MIGSTLGAYRILGLAGRGGMGEVYLAEDTRLGRTVALKVLPADARADPDRLNRFRREARALASLNHPGIVTIHSVEEEEGIAFLTMELVGGTTLTDCIVPGGLPAAEFMDLALQITDALAAAHDSGVIHRDLKPGNVMRTPAGRIKILDFGLARRDLVNVELRSGEPACPPVAIRPTTWGLLFWTTRWGSCSCVAVLSGSCHPLMARSGRCTPQRSNETKGWLRTNFHSKSTPSRGDLPSRTDDLGGAS